MSGAIKLKPASPVWTYTVPIDECDVKDREKLAHYRSKRHEWLEWHELQETQPNSIQQQIFSMMFLDIAYRMISKARNVPEALNVAAKSGLLSHLLDQGYIATQVLSIRRLLDPRRDVVSLRRMVNGIIANKDLFTREVYVCHDGVPYDQDAWQEFPDSPEKQIWGIQAPGFRNFLVAQIRHEKFDRLSGICSANRTRSDVVKESVFERLLQWLNTPAADKLITLSHKFLAHAADLNSLGSLIYSGIQLADVEEVQRAIIRVERAITDELLLIGVARNVVPMPPLGLLKGLDNPFLPTTALASMEEHWDQLSKERDHWPKSVMNDLTSP